MYKIEDGHNSVSALWIIVIVEVGASRGPFLVLVIAFPQ